MPLSYHDAAADQNTMRLANLSDSIFAVAMTLLVLEVKVPVDYIKTERQLWNALLALGPRFLVYFMSFLTLGVFWNAQQTQLNRFARGDRNLTWIHIAFLAIVSVTPFSTALEENFIRLRVALAVFWLTLLLLGLTLYSSWRYAVGKGFLRDDVSYQVQQAIEGRILLAQTLYAAGFVLCVFNTLWSIAAIAMVQLVFALTPTIRWFRRQRPPGRGGP